MSSPTTSKKSDSSYRDLEDPGDAGDRRTVNYGSISVDSPQTVGLSDIPVREAYADEFAFTPKLTDDDRCLLPTGGSDSAANCWHRFRYLVCALVLLGTLLNNYTNHTLYIAAIEMVSGDVLEAGLTELRATHIAQDPLAQSRNAASPGTCPIELETSSAVKSLIAQAVASALHNDTANMVNLTQVSQDAWHSMVQGVESLVSYVDGALATGRLVDWSVNDRALIFSAHTIGSIVFSVPLSQLGLTYGNKLPISVAFAACTLRALLLPPLVSHCNFWLVFLFELVVGAPGQNIAIVVYPLLASWLLTAEANVLVGLVPLASLLGDTLASFVTTQLLAEGVAWSWCFYSHGLVLAALTLLWLWAAADEPEQSRFVSSGELVLLEHSLANVRRRRELDELRRLNLDLSARCACGDPSCPARLLRRVPNWRALVTCSSIWALFAVSFTSLWNSKSTNLWPTYLANMLHLDTQTVGLIIGVRGFVLLICGGAISYFTRNLSLRRPFNMSLTAYRKWGQLLAASTLAASIGAITIFDCSVAANTLGIMLTPLVTAFEAISAGQMTYDLATEDSGLIQSYLRMIALGDVLCLPVLSYVLSFGVDALAGDRLTWRIVWLIGLGLRLLALLLFLLLAKTDTGRQYSRLAARGKCRALTRGAK